MTYESKHSKNSEYLGILILPPKANIKSVSTHLASLTRLDAKNIEYRLRGGAPAIIGSVTPKEACEAIQWMTNHTIESASTNDQELLSRGKPTVVKDIEINEGQLSIESKKNQQFLVPFSSVRSIVYGNIGLPKPHTKLDRTSHIENRAFELPLATPITGHVISRQNLTSSKAKSNASKSLRQIIDLHCYQDKEWTLFRIDGDKQGWRHLGKARGYSDLHNAQQTLELFRLILSSATCDECFREFALPKSARKQIHKETPREIRLFDFYSRWIAQMHQNIQGL